MRYWTKNLSVFYQTVRDEFEVSLKFGILKIIHIQVLSFFEGFNKILHKICSFCTNESEQNEAKSILFSKRHNFKSFGWIAYNIFSLPVRVATLDSNPEP